LVGQIQSRRIAVQDKGKTRTRPLPEIACLSQKAADLEKSPTVRIPHADHWNAGEG